jgi:hypothetical protein
MKGDVIWERLRDLKSYGVWWTSMVRMVDVYGKAGRGMVDIYGKYGGHLW